MPNTILLKGDPMVQEKDAGAIITPGELLAIDGSGNVIPHGTAGGNAVPKMVAYENDLIGNDIDDDYASGGRVRYLIPQAGDVLYMFLADTENVSEGDPLQCDGNGDLEAHVVNASYNEAIVGVAAEDLNNSAGGARARIRVRIS